MEAVDEKGSGRISRSKVRACVRAASVQLMRGSRVRVLERRKGAARVHHLCGKQWRHASSSTCVTPACIDCIGARMFHAVQGVAPVHDLQSVYRIRPDHPPRKPVTFVIIPICPVTSPTPLPFVKPSYVETTQLFPTTKFSVKFTVRASLVLAEFVISFERGVSSSGFSPHSITEL